MLVLASFFANTSSTDFYPEEATIAQHPLCKNSALTNLYKAAGIYFFPYIDGRCVKQPQVGKAISDDFMVHIPLLQCPPNSINALSNVVLGLLGSSFQMSRRSACVNARLNKRASWKRSR